MESVVFYFLSGVSIAMAFVVAATRRPTYAVLALVGCFLAVAGLYGLLGATFLAAVQIIVYAGAVGVVFLIVIVLLDSSGETSSRERRGGLRWGATLVGLALFGLIATAVFEGSGATPQSSVEATRGSAAAMGNLLLTHYLALFAATAVLVLAALVGATRLARR